MKSVSALVGVLFVLALPSVAIAQSSTCQQYNPQTCQSVGSMPGSTPTTPTTKPTAPTSPTSPSTTPVALTSPTTSAAAPAVTSGSLPFTGLDVGFLVAAAGVLLSIGFVIRRVSSRMD
jgi:hypothetical protein